MGDLTQVLLKLQILGWLPKADYSRLGASALVRQLRENTELSLLEFDCESIESKWDYPRLLRELLDLVEPPFDVRRIRCELDREQGRAQLTFQCQGEAVEWAFSQQSDWVSDDFLDKLSALVHDNTNGELMVMPTSDSFVCVVYLPVKADG